MRVLHHHMLGRVPFFMDVQQRGLLQGQQQSRTKSDREEPTH
jgi:hypothetical protein